MGAARDGRLAGRLIAALLADKNEYVRAWAIQLALDREKPQLAKLLPQFAAMAKSDPSPVVRLYLASAMQRVPVERSLGHCSKRLARHAEDAGDHNLPLMYWYAAEPLAEADPERALAFGLSCGKTIPLVRDFMLRRIGSLDTPAALAALVRALGKSSDADEQLAILRGIRSALAGQRRVEAARGMGGRLPQDCRRATIQNVRSRGDGARRHVWRRGGDGRVARLDRIARKPTPQARRDALEALLAAKDPQAW